MGFGDVLDSMSCMPPADGTEARFRVAAASIQRGVPVRRNLIAILDRFRDLQGKARRAPSWMTPEQKTHYEAVAVCDVRTDRFGDSIFYSTYLTRYPGRQQLGMLSTHLMLTTCALGCIYQLAEGKDQRDTYPLRGAIAMDLGIAVADVKAREGSPPALYSAAQAEAYRLERYEAGCAFILVSEGLISFLEVTSRAPNDGADAVANANLARRCQALLYRDEKDGLWALDFLGTEMRFTTLTTACAKRSKGLGSQ